MNIRLAENIKELRENAGLTQQNLAQQLGTTQRKVSYWENGSVEPDLSYLWKLADFFEISIDELIGRTSI